MSKDIELAKKLAEIEAAFAWVDEVEIGEVLAKLQKVQNCCKAGLQAVASLRKELEERLSA